MKGVKNACARGTDRHNLTRHGDVEGGVSGHASFHGTLARRDTPEEAIINVYHSLPRDGLWVNV